MASSSPAKKARPLSPHLQIYKPQITSGMSIFHRFTGIALSFGLPVFVAWIVAVASGPAGYVQFTGLFHNIVGQILLFGWTFSFFYHFCCGLRHLAWDAGFGLNIKSVNSTGRVAIGVSVLLTIGIWLKAYGVMQCAVML